MRPAPREIDGARVLDWAWSDLPFGEVRYADGAHAAVVHGLALCRYEGASEVDRFSCNADWECEQDQVHESVEAAKQALLVQYCRVPVVWQSGI